MRSNQTTKMPPTPIQYRLYKVRTTYVGTIIMTRWYPLPTILLLWNSVVATKSTADKKILAKEVEASSEPTCDLSVS